MQLTSTRSSAIRRPRRRKVAAASLVAAKLTGKYYSYGAGTVGFGCFWEDTDNTLHDLTFNSTSGTTFDVNERQSQVQTDHDQNWNTFEIDLDGMSNGRIVFYGRKTSGSDHYKADIALDSLTFISRDETSIDLAPNTAATRSNNLWKRDDAGSTHSVSSYSSAKSVYSGLDASSDFENMPTFDFTSSSGGNDGLQWNYRKGGTSSGDTGPDNASDDNDDSVYVYWEATGTSSSFGGFLVLASFYNIITGAAL